MLHAHQEPGQPRYRQTLDEYERCSGATVVDRYFSCGTEGAVLLRHRRRFARPMYRIAVFHDGAATSPEFGELLRRIQLMERHSAVQLDGHAHQILVQSLFGLVVSLLSALAADQTTPDGNPRRVDAALTAADGELTALSRFVQSSSRRSSLGLYLAGLPVGAVIGSALVVLAAHSLTIGAIVAQPNLPICLASGAIGAVISVMARVSAASESTSTATRVRSSPFSPGVSGRSSARSSVPCYTSWSAAASFR